MPKLIHKDKTLHQFMLQIKDKCFRCKCGCNVFHIPDDQDLNLYQCNGCETKYRGE